MMGYDSSDGNSSVPRSGWKWALPTRAVRYPCAWKSSPTVCSLSGSLVPSAHAPCWLGYLPVTIEDRDGVHVGLVQ